MSVQKRELLKYLYIAAISMELPVPTAALPGIPTVLGMERIVPDFIHQGKGEHLEGNMNLSNIMINLLYDPVCKNYHHSGLTMNSVL